MAITKHKALKLKPSARDTRRYFIFNASQEKAKEAILEYLGVLGMAKAAYEGVVVKEIKSSVGSCLVKSLDDVRAAFLFKNIRIEKVSGTIKGLTA